jgi:hypothetical protein
MKSLPAARQSLETRLNRTMWTRFLDAIARLFSHNKRNVVYVPRPWGDTPNKNNRMELVIVRTATDYVFRYECGDTTAPAVKAVMRELALALPSMMERANRFDGCPGRIKVRIDVG